MNPHRSQPSTQQPYSADLSPEPGDLSLDPGALSLDPGALSLDPGDWGRTRNLFHKVVDKLIDGVHAVRDRKVWVKPTARDGDASDSANAPLPERGQSLAQVWDEIQSRLLAFPLGNDHPRFWGWVMGNGSLDGTLADLIASALNPNLFGAECGALRIEEEALAWVRELFDFPSSSGATFVSGASMANLTALVVARDRALARTDGNVVAVGTGETPTHDRAAVDFRKLPQLRFYVSEQTHNCVHKSLHALGIAPDALRKIPCDRAHRIHLEALRAAIEDDLTKGLLPAAICANAGTVNTGAIDDLKGLLRLREALRGRSPLLPWIHVDGAFGAAAYLCPEGRAKLSGLGEVDSLAVDFHKWLYMPYGVAAVLVRDKDRHRQTFTHGTAYLSHASAMMQDASYKPKDYGLELSRGFRSLKVWVGLRHHGVSKYGALIAQNMGQASYLARLVQGYEELELMAPVELNIVCLRYIGTLSDHCDENRREELNRCNAHILAGLQQEGIAAPSHTMLEGRFAIRVAITNHRSRNEDFDLLIREVLIRGRAYQHSLSSKGDFANG